MLGRYENSLSTDALLRQAGLKSAEKYDQYFQRLQISGYAVDCKFKNPINSFALMDINCPTESFTQRNGLLPASVPAQFHSELPEVANFFSIGPDSNGTNSSAKH